jgi:hypothetical protein
MRKLIPYLNDRKYETESTITLNSKQQQLSINTTKNPRIHAKTSIYSNKKPIELTKGLIDILPQPNKWLFEKFI